MTDRTRRPRSTLQGTLIGATQEDGRQYVIHTKVRGRVVHYYGPFRPRCGELWTGDAAFRRVADFVNEFELWCICTDPFRLAAPPPKAGYSEAWECWPPQPRGEA